MIIPTVLQRWLEVPTTDPEDSRRRKLLGILLLGVIGAVVLLLIGATVVIAFTGNTGTELEVALLYVTGLVALAGIVIIFLINRYYSGTIASVLFLVLFTILAAFSDEPSQVVAGRSVFIFVIPTLMASVLLRPSASFLFAGLSSLFSVGVALSINYVPNLPAIFAFFMVATVSWLSARSLEQALRELRVINYELDQRVAQRTKDLSEALWREQIESGRNQAILKSIADGVIVFDNQKRAIVANPSIAHLLGRSEAEILNTDIRTLMRDEVSEADRDLADRVLTGAEITKPSMKFRWGAKMLSVSFAAVRNPGGGIMGNVMVFRDFTREAELDRMKSALLSMSSHELRTPLNAILGYSDMLLESVYGPITPQQRTTVERMMANTKRMLGLINNLLDQAQIEAGKLTIHFAPFNPQDLLKEVESVASILAINKKLKFECEIEPQIPATLVSDAQRLSQILLNLTGNAVKFTKQGSVSVRVYLADEAHWGIAVKDTGMGIPHDAQSYIFEAFRQVDDPSTRDTIGSGLGLSIVKQLVHLLQGEIHLESEVGQGSTFTVVLPLAPIQEEVK